MVPAICQVLGFRSAAGGARAGLGLQCCHHLIGGGAQRGLVGEACINQVCDVLGAVLGHPARASQAGGQAGGRAGRAAISGLWQDGWQAARPSGRRCASSSTTSAHTSSEFAAAEPCH